jgi:hypothetical protein
MAVASGQQELTQRMHADFWREVRNGPTASPAQLRTVMVGALDLNLAYQRAAWQSALASRKAKSSIRTPELATLDAEYLKRVNALMRLSAGGQKQLSDAFEVMKSDARRLIQAGADGSAFVLSSGLQGVVSETAVASALQDLAATEGRINQLLDPKWRSKK